MAKQERKKLTSGPELAHSEEKTGAGSEESSGNCGITTRLWVRDMDWPV